MTRRDAGVDDRAPAVYLVGTLLWGDLRTMNDRLACSVLVLVLVCIGGSPSAARGRRDCEAFAAAGLGMPGLKITATTYDEAGEAGAPGALPAHCRVDGVLDRRTGSDGRPYAIGFAVNLPDDWNGRFLFQGGGGLNGSVRPPVGGTAAGDESALARGFAVASTDSGHEGAGFDGSFYADQEAALNFLYKAVGRVTQVAKRIIAEYYGEPAARSYFAGCSTGGREAMMMSQRYPTYFDGIVAGAPAMRTAYSNLGLRWVRVTLAEAPLGEGDAKLIADSAVAACDAGDGLADGMIFATAACEFAPDELVCRRGRSDACLTEAQAGAVAKALAGPRTAGGQQVYPGYFYDSGIAARGRGLPGILIGPPIPEGEANPTSIDVDAEAYAAANARSSLGNTHAWTNLGTFTGHGGKIIFYHGVSDPWFSARETVRYFESLADGNGGAEAVAEWGRLYLVPGMGHCAGGEVTLDRFDLLSEVVDWVERGDAPASVIATGDALPGRSRPLCPYPAHAHYKGTGDSEDAANFECR